MRTLLTSFVLLLAAVGRTQTPDSATGVRSAELDSNRPYFIPTHPRVTTTIRFPAEIGAPDGSVMIFAEDAVRAGGAEYLVGWQNGDAYFTVTPLKEARMANLNVPYHGCTYVFYFYQVADPLQAVAAVTLAEVRGGVMAVKPDGAGSPPPEVVRTRTAPDPGFLAATPARLLGFLDRLKLVHVTPAGPDLAALATAMQIDVSETDAVGSSPGSLPAGAAGRECAGGRRALNDAGLFQLVLLRAVRDRRLNCVGFVCLLRNTSDQVLTFDVNSFGARAGAEYLVQRISDAAPTLTPGEQAPAYFIVQADRNSPLSAANEWKLSVDLVRPRVNPGAAITRAFAAERRSK